MKFSFITISILYFLLGNFVSAQEKIFPGADENTPSKSEYFSWINNTNEGATEEQTQTNLDFFKWMKDEYGMQLDIYALDAGAIDGKRFYGSIRSERFKKQFPYSFDSIYDKSRSLGIRLGVWGGPDGFGDSPSEEKERIEQMVKLCKDYDFALFKFDAVGGLLRPEKEDAFIKMMEQCRFYSPDLILLNHRLGLKKSKPYATTFLWGGDETYIDVFMNNDVTAPHHRAGALSRGLTPDLKRLTEDHGVCISSCLDYWDDDLVLQAFNRSLILSPQIYGNPWFLRDDEFSKLARIFNIHKKYRDILINGIVLQKDKYGPDAVSRGDNQIRLITHKNLEWNPKKHRIKLGTEIGLSENKKVNLIQIHPYEYYFGSFDFNEEVEVTIEPFRAALFIATTEDYNEPLINGSEFNVVKNIEGQMVLIDVIGNPGTNSMINLVNYDNFENAEIDGVPAKKIISGKKQRIHFSGEKLNFDVHRKIANFHETSIPEDSDALYEATVFAADNNALEVRSLFRSGKTNIQQVRKTREAFFNQKVFVDRGIWDKNLFDADLKTGFWKSKKYSIEQSFKGGAFRLDLGKITPIDELAINIPDDFSLQPLLADEGNYVEISLDLKNWKRLIYLARKEIHIKINDTIRYLRFKEQPQQIVEINGYYKGKTLDRSEWKASNLFAHPDEMKPIKAWKTSFKLEEIAGNSYLSIALKGKHGIEGAYVAAKIDGILVGAPDRAVSYPSNTWEYVNAKKDHDYTYYIPLNQSYINKQIDLYVLAYDKQNTEITPEVWISSTDPKSKIRLKLYSKKNKNKIDNN